MTSVTASEAKRSPGHGGHARNKEIASDYAIVAREKTHMKKGDILLAALVIIFLGLVLWIFYTGKFNALAGSFIDEVWNSIQRLIQPIFRR